jgi:O-antigen/teichoic acid export membrane protein
VETEPQLTDVETLLRGNKPVSRFAVADLRSIATSNTSLAILDQSVVSGTRFLTTIFIGRVCGKEELGIYALIFAVFLIFVCLQESLVTTPYVVFANRMKGRSRRTFAASVVALCFAIGFASMLMVVGGSLLLYAWSGPAELIPTSLAMGLVLPFILLWHLARSFSIAHLRLRHALALDVVTSALQIGVLVWLTWRTELTSAGGYIALGAGCACTGLAWLVMSRRRLRFRRSQYVADWRRNFSFGRWVLAGQIMGAVHGYLPAWVIAIAIGTAATGVFSACESIVLLSNPLILAIANLYGATTARAYAKGGYWAVRKIVQQAALYCSAAMLLLWLLLVLMGGPFVALLYGDEFAGNGSLVSTIALAAPFWALGAIMAVALRAVDRPEIDFRAKLLGVLITLIGSALTVNVGGVSAVAYSLVAGSIVSALYLTWAFYLQVPAEPMPLSSE